ncbi:DNA polymerase V subunit UmuC, partial [Acinetobacter baumannii]|nr:DNA polymerase V subunit UmuC [Acinetobacter baumannii]
MKHNNKVFLLVDVNNMYVACERVFNPHLNNRPVIVLSNGDGCVVARSNEAKMLGIKMSDPLFRIKDIVQANKVVVLSSNYVLYGEMSRRFHKILSHFVSPESHEPYSIDEGFIELTDYRSIYDLTSCAEEIKDRLQMWLGLPVCVGIGRSKTESKAM